MNDPVQSDAPEGAVDLPRLVRRFWSEFMVPAELDAEELAECDPQEMAVFAFLVGAGMPWAEARMAENLDILEASAIAQAPKPAPKDL